MSLKISPFSGTELNDLVEGYFSLYNEFLSHPAFDSFDKAITPLLHNYPNRSASSIVAGFCQISTVLVNHNLPYITVLEPLMSSSASIEEVVFKKLKKDDTWTEKLLKFCSFQDFPQQQEINMGKLLEDLPDTSRTKSNTDIGRFSNFSSVNFLQIEQDLSALKDKALKVALKYEKFRLALAGKDYLLDHLKSYKLADQQSHGCTIQSKNEDGTNRYILVVGTKLGKLSPFFFSENELAFSKEKPEQFYVYRIFNTLVKPRLYILQGPLDKIKRVHPIQFQANFH